MIKKAMIDTVKKLPYNSGGSYVRTRAKSGCHVYFPMGFKVQDAQTLDLALQFKDTYQSLLTEYEEQYG